MTPVFFTDRDLGRRFPSILLDAGIRVERHEDHFRHNTPDEVWLAEVAARNWYVLTHDKRIGRNPLEIAAVMDHGCGLFVVIGKAPMPLLARNVVATMPRILAFIRRHEPPYIAKIHRPVHCPDEQLGSRPGKVVLWRKG